MSLESLHTIQSNVIKVVCISDTHNDDPTSKIPPGDMFIHAGDMVRKGTSEESQNAFDWISALPHKVKVIIAGRTFRESKSSSESMLTCPGNNDRALQQGHLRYSPETHDLFTSEAARAQGIHYLDREVRTVAFFTTREGNREPIQVYGNASSPDFQGGLWVGTPGQPAFDFPAHPSEESIQAWITAPTRSAGIPIWVTHVPPLERLDASSVKGLKGCAVLLEKVAAARPLLSVVGHYHFSHGIERVSWKDDGSVAEAEMLVMGEERRRAGGGGPARVNEEYDFTGNGSMRALERGKETVFLNAAWMTDDKSKEERNPVLVVDLKMD
jgi:Icc-related predicted phosphoesterase